MKTTINLPDGLWESARHYAKKHNTTVTALIQEGLHRVMQEPSQPAVFELRDCSWGDGGLTPEFQGRGWDDLRDAAYWFAPTVAILIGIARH